MVRIDNGTVRFKKGRQIPLVDFPALFLRHLDSDPTTPCVESFAASYVQATFPVARTKALVRAVCKWGGDNRISFKILRDNHVKKIASRLRSSYELLDDGNPTEAIRKIKELDRVGISYGSKHLKFLAPDRAVVLDRIIRTKCGYKNSPEDFAEFIQDCAQIRDELNRLNIDKPGPFGEWRVSDVEMAVFAKVAKI